ELRRGRPAEALLIAESSPHELMRLLAPLAVKQYSAADLESTAAAAAYASASAGRRHEDVLTGLARVAPATGLVGTTLGLIAQLRNLPWTWRRAEPCSTPKNRCMKTLPRTSSG